MKRVPFVRTTACLCALIPVLAFCGTNAGAQLASGTVTGRLTDSAGAVVPDSQVTLTKTDTGFAFHASTNSEGVYNFPALGTGPHLLQVEQPGFKKAEVRLTLTVGQTATLNVALVVGRSGETVDVQASTLAELEVSDATISYTVGARQVSDLPLNGRNPFGLAALALGINPGAALAQAWQPSGARLWLPVRTTSNLMAALAAQTTS